MAFTHATCGGQHDTVAEARACEAPASAPSAPEDAYNRPSGLFAEEGFYKVGETYFKVQKAVHGSGRVYAKELVELPQRDADGNLIEKGRWEMARGIVSRLRPEDLLSAEEGAEFGKLYGICMYCWRELTDERSIEVGYGPICADKRGLPWGD